MPSSKESAFYRRKNDERVEMRGLPCRVYRAKDGGGKTVDVFGDVTVVGGEVTPVRSWVILEHYQKEKSRIGDDRATEEKELPLVGTFRFADDVRRLDLVEIPYEYVRAAGLSQDFAGTPNNPRQTLYTRFKLVNRVTSGINSDLINKFYLAPTEEVWGAALP